MYVPQEFQATEFSLGVPLVIHEIEVYLDLRTQPLLLPLYSHVRFLFGPRNSFFFHPQLSLFSHLLKVQDASFDPFCGIQFLPV